MSIETYNPNSITVTQSGKEYLLQQVEKNDALGVSLSLMPNGCAGFEYNWDFVVTEFYQQDYHIVKLDDKVLLVNNLSFPYLEGSVIKLQDDGIKGISLVVESPKATGSCGCGESVTFDV